MAPIKVRLILSKSRSIKYIQWGLVMAAVILLGGVYLIDLVKENFYDDSVLREGVVVYEVSYPEISEDHLLKPFLPTRMELSVRKNKMRFETKAGIGLFQTGYILDNRSRELDAFLKLINVKYASKYNEEAVINSLLQEPAITVDMTGETASMMGLNCKVSTLSFKGLKDQRLCYTEDLSIPGLNWHTAYADIPGLLLEYDLFKGGVHMHLKVLEIRRESVPSKAFELGDDYQFIQNKDYDRELAKTFTALK